MPNKCDRDGLGPVDRITVASLKFNANKKSTPKEHHAFTELAEWVLVNLEAGRVSFPAGWKPPDAEDGGEHTETGEVDEEEAYYKALTHRLLAINRDATAALLDEAPPETNPMLHSARKLWRSIPQPAHMPAVCFQQ